jgi:hypothetical protein
MMAAGVSGGKILESNGTDKLRALPTLIHLRYSSVSRSLLLLNRSVSRFLLTLLRTSASVWKPIANATGGGTWIGGEGRTGEILESTPGSEFMY